MTPLRQRMIEDMQLRNLTPATQRNYIHHVAALARYYQLSPEHLRHPPPGPNVSRYEVSLWTGLGERYIIARHHFAGNTNDPVAMMIVKKVGESFLSDLEARMPSNDFASGLRQRQTNPGEALKPG